MGDHKRRVLKRHLFSPHDRSTATATCLPNLATQFLWRPAWAEVISSEDIYQFLFVVTEGRTTPSKKIPVETDLCYVIVHGS
jgi:hypothetical protein